MVEIFVLVGALGAIGSACASMANIVFESRRHPSPAPRMLRFLAGAVASGARRLPPRIGNSILEALAPLWLVLTMAFWPVLLLLGTGLLGRYAELMSVRVPPPAYAVAFGAALLLPVAVAVGVARGYLRTYVGAYQRREREVVRIAAQLVRHRNSDHLAVSCLHPAVTHRADRLLAEWTDWLTDLRRTHLSCPVLIYSASRGTLTWPRAAVAVLDAAALIWAVAPSHCPPRIPVLLTAGAQCLQAIAWKAGVVAGGAPVSLEYREESLFSDSVRLVVCAGMPEERGRQQTWAAFQRARSAYAPYATALEFHILRRSC